MLASRIRNGSSDFSLVLALALSCVGCGSESDEKTETSSKACGAPSSLDALPAPALAWSHASQGIDYFSPRAADLDGDGKLEVVTSGGSEIPRHGEVVALDGTTGAHLWRVEAEYQLYGSPVFVDVTGDGVKDVFVGGRSETFLAVDGASGALLWSFVDTRTMPEYYFYNFYTAVPIDDVTGDGIEDLLVANGGADGDFEPGAPRPPGHLAVLDAKTGAVVAAAHTPDLEETYLSTIIVPDAGTTSPTILFGTGGETRQGGFWKTTLDDVLAGDISGAKLLWEGDQKGVIAPPALGDLNGDGRLDIIVATFNGRMIAFDGRNDAILWEIGFNDSETFSTPTLGYFDDDDRPDVFAVFLHGVFPAYDLIERAVFSGAHGNTLWEGSGGTFTMAGDVAVDLDGDGEDEVIWSSSDWNAEPSVGHTLHLFDARSNTERQWGPPLGAPSPSSPWAGDLDSDGCLDLVVATHTPTMETNEAGIARFRIAAKMPKRLSWGGYLGTSFDSIVPRR